MITYDLKTPSGKQWGYCVKDEYVSENFEELCNKLKLIWEKHANTF
jgi:hypothetical protein